MEMTNSPEDFFGDVLERNRNLKQQAEAAIAQITDKAFFESPGSDSNSIAIIVKHLAGNLRSRWRDFLISDGEKPDRNRDSEFELTAEDTKISLMQRWDEAFQILFDTLQSLSEKDRFKKIRIRGNELSVMQATTRQLAHLAFHVGQIIYLCKLYAGSNWKSLSVEKGKSQDYNLNIQKNVTRL